jgi:hypothetical protein
LKKNENDKEINKYQKRNNVRNKNERKKNNIKNNNYSCNHTLLVIRGNTLLVFKPDW